jgi:ribosomal-protein-alanine N-acetyltransferase
MWPLAVNIRPMAAADLARILEIAGSLPEAPNWPRPLYAMATDPAATPPRIALVAEESTASPSLGVMRILGFAIVRVLPPEAELETIAVTSAAQRKGIGVGLLSALLADLRLRQVRSVLLEVRASNFKARSFYRVLGFRDYARRPRYYSGPEEDAMLMKLDL